MGKKRGIDSKKELGLAPAATTISAVEPKKSESKLHTFSGFTVLPITVAPPTVLSELDTQSLRLHFSPEIVKSLQPERPDVNHYLFMRPHSSRSTLESLPAHRTLFIVNLPVDTNIMHLRRLFRRCGVIERVVWKGLLGLEGENDDVDSIVVNETLVRRVHGWIHPTGSHAHVVFKDDESIEHVLAMKPRKRMWSDVIDEDDQQTDDIDPEETQAANQMGINKWILQHIAMFPKTDHLQSQVDQAMSLFDDSEERAKQELEKKHNAPDDDGFVLVTRGRGKYNTSSDGKGAVVTVAQESAKTLKPKNLGLVDFYRFQKREAKRNELAELRRKFEEDKSKIEVLKTKRRFKPY
ncbi:hypothetical protein BATDEDRAFT_86342 [Batrachochytrium dendrobatidis JAM81]|uniref:RRM domain-containing protein n=2 Tax=Batrachochytrium dendrobatidis TaxID=109871 RepID=F4NWT9_BATDJ|nr:uncharacterized protein BATDEDRAFT_86342 [Batrachochytrium dendrobatidis JAM81]EGF82547.1 hypothetical protein BATDEDRAFT_86342 [Batrachochytrium dendrobatidis JAM81]OAJ39416.1 hypothetical protein BDEG_23265 [Batrachochytrium dendrobatidis JEL423]|eukprot:XP_006676963.1 hypothetical protein BATDEDRAFT_86342 [Batrachochytrium dendrobatidis JAM81]